MSANSLESLLNQMKGGSVTHGWGAIAAFGRAQLNRLLEQQYLAWLSDSRFVPPISGDIVLADGAESVKLEDLFLGKPVLSFATASLNLSVVTLKMNIVGGTYTAMSHAIGSVPRLMSSFSITEEMGYHIELKVDLGQVEGEVDKRGRVTLDLGSDPTMKCNLGGFAAIQTKIAAFIHTRLAALPGDARTFELGLFDFSGYNPLSPKGFYLRTQRAPGADDPSALNYGDGAVLVFIRLKVKDENGEGLPSDGSGFPYLIPDDQAAGKQLYSASLVLNHENLGLLEETQLDVLKNLLFPGENIFVESTNGRHTPFDLLVLGNVKATEESVEVQPPFVSLKGGKEQQFSARKSDGSTINATWSVSNPIDPLSVGTITVAGLYTAPVTQRMGKERQPIVVTAQYADAGRQQTRSALVLGVFESMGVSPRVNISGVGASANPIPLTVSSVAGAELVWPTLTPAEGVLTVIDNNHAIYTPPASLAAPLAIQKISVSEKLTNELIEATIVLVAAPHNLPVEPPYVASATASLPIQLSTQLPPDVLLWEVIGEGSVDQFGLFTPPQAPTSRFSVVKCSYSDHGIVLASGFSVIQLTEQLEPVPHWLSLEKFTIEAVGGRDTAFANGCQQIPVLITLETKTTTVGGQEYDIPVSDAELATLRLVDKATGAEVPFVHVAQEGIEYGSGTQFAANKKRNRFRFFSRTGTSDIFPLAPDAPTNNRERRRELYIQMGVGGSRTFYARFQGVGNRTFNSIDYVDPGKDEVTVHAEIFLPPDPDPDPNKSPYKFTRDRVTQDRDGYDLPPSAQNPEGDYFSFYRWSTDYWRLNFNVPTSAGSRIVPFVTSSIEANISSLQWESELLDEKFFSYTGCAFNPANYEGSNSPVPEGLSFDPYLWGLIRERRKKLNPVFEDGKEPAAGEFVVSLHRVDDMPYWYDGMANGDERKLFRKNLEPGLKITLLDIDGNRHALQVSFESIDKEDSRNKLVLRRQ
ncbi:hypothetical protein [Pseudomonas sp. IT-P4]|uniref:hypothetical protein n=1 Tax=Pseudomonas sp. IT-P4 TaxID=3026446 RepID=UPI0039E1AD0D